MKAKIQNTDERAGFFISNTSSTETELFNICFCDTVWYSPFFHLKTSKPTYMPGLTKGLVPTPTIGTNFGTKLAVLKGTEFSVNFHQFFCRIYSCDLFVFWYVFCLRFLAPAVNFSATKRFLRVEMSSVVSFRRRNASWVYKCFRLCMFSDETLYDCGNV